MSYGYSTRLIELNNNADDQLLGVRLGRVCIANDVPVLAVAMALGVSRQTVYNWLSDGEVMGAYRPPVERLINILQTAKTADEAWGVACREFNLQA